MKDLAVQAAMVQETPSACQPASNLTLVLRPTDLYAVMALLRDWKSVVSCVYKHR
jgi:hypothetical protein